MNTHLLGDAGASLATGEGSDTANRSCLISLCIYCPKLSCGKEERALDNIIYFYPSRTHPDQQMNHVGFCIGIMCLTERFLPSSAQSASPVEEVRLSHSIITLCNPYPDLWIAVETTPAYNASVVLPMTRLGFDAFVLRYGISSAAALVFNPRDRESCNEISEARAALRRHYDKFVLFLKTSALVIDADSNSHAAGRLSGGPMTPVDVTTSQDVPLSRVSFDSSYGISSTQRNNQQWKRHLSTVASAESLLSFPVVIRAAEPEFQLACHSIVLRHISFLLSGLKKGYTSCWGTECDGVPDSSVTETIIERSAEQLLWTRCRYIVFVSKSLKVVASNIPQDVTTKLTCLFSMDPELSNFTIHINGEVAHCCVWRTDSLLTIVLCDETLYQTMQISILSACKMLTDDIAECLSSGISNFTRAPSVSSMCDVQRCDSKSLQFHGRAGSPGPSMAGDFLLGPLTGSGRLSNTKSTLQWTVWHDGMLFGSPLHEYIRNVQLSLSAPMRQLIEQVRVECKKGETCVVSQAGEPEGVTSNVDSILRGSKELWVSLSNSTYLCVARDESHVGGAVFYNSPTFSSCFKAAASIFNGMSFAF
uniref:Uncharacterized protein TCIL3000_11_10660 n=1 Tax=Trypanosoma congolense (strain IL3000) TaxID=1068625 RepID=G0V1S3_TRYCI|nr:unnamed protein product [Trypanosoma congolense IL3000]